MAADPTTEALLLVLCERTRQDELKAAGRFTYTCADNGMTNAEKLAALGEELGEALDDYAALRLGVLLGRVAREVLTQEEHRLARDTVGTREALRGELVQVAAVAVAWVEALL